MNISSNQITLLLADASRGDQRAVDRLMPVVYAHLQEIARRQLHGERVNHTLNTTALVHEAYLKLVDQRNISWQNRAHFFAISAQAMRRILINYARSRMADKRGGGGPLATFDEANFVQEARATELVELDEALSRLGTMSERQAKIVEYRFYGGLTQEEIAEVLGVSVPTIRRDWRVARAWLTRELSRASGGSN